MKNPVRVAVSGGAGQISYSLLFRIASGNMLGADQPVILQLLEIPPVLDALKGVVMELEDCAFPALHSVVATADPEVAFGDADYCMLVGAKPRGPGMERKDLLQANANIFSKQGKVIDQNASRNVRVLVVGNPANTNALIAMHQAKRLDMDQFTAMTRLDHNRAVIQLALKTGSACSTVKKVTIWGNHSLTQYPDIHHATVDGKPAIELVSDEWMKNEFMPTVQKRGAAVIEARGLSSAASAGSAAVDHIRTWVSGTDQDDWTSMAIVSKGAYGISEGLIYSVPVTCKNGSYSVVEGLEISDFSREQMKATEKELSEERDAIRDLL